MSAAADYARRFARWARERRTGSTRYRCARCRADNVELFEYRSTNGIRWWLCATCVDEAARPPMLRGAVS